MAILPAEQAKTRIPAVNGDTPRRVSGGACRGLRFEVRRTILASQPDITRDPARGFESNRAPR